MNPTKRRLIITLVTLLLVAMIPAGVMAAGGTFIDDDTSIFESNIEWLADAGVTLGCNPAEGNTKFCPEDNVTRGQMAAFMQRFAQYIGAEDGTPAEADHAATADEATEAAQADNATTLGGKGRLSFQPSTNDFDADTLSVTTNGTRTVVSAEVATTDGSGFFCLIGSSQTADIRVHASGTVTAMSAGESASFRLTDESGAIAGTNRYVYDSNGSFAVEWLYELVPGGSMEFGLENYEANGDQFAISASIFVEVISDTRCKGTSLIVFPSEPTVAGPDDI